MGDKHIRRFRRQVRESVVHTYNSGGAQETAHSTAVIYARHWVTAGVITARQALRGLAMITGTPLVRVKVKAHQRLHPVDRPVVLMFKPAQGETWLGRMRSGWV
jgi:hypothetical protein